MAFFFHLRNQNDGKKSEEPEEDESIWKLMKEMISFELLKNPRFLLVAISTCLLYKFDAADE